MKDLKKKSPTQLTAACVPEPIQPLFLRAQQYVADYFADRVEDPRHSTISISGERYILVRAASMSVEFFDLVTSLYRDKGPVEARSVANNLLFDVAHAIGKADAKAFHQRMQVTDPIEKLSAGPIHFAYSGWAFVDIFPQSSPSPDENYFLIYDHPFSFEADSWIKQGRKVEFPVCIMNAGYSSGWCEESFGLPLVATEVACLARGDKACRFIMAPPHRIEGYVARYQENTAAFGPARGAAPVPAEIPEFFKRRRLEDALRRSESRFRAVFESAGTGIAVVGLDGRVLEVNHRVLELLGYTTEEMRRFRSTAEFTHPEDVEVDTQLHAELFSGKRDHYVREKRYLAKDGRIIWGLATVSLVRHSTGEPEFAIAMVEDVTQRKAAEEALRRSEELATAGRLAATIAHEINNPLEAVTNLLYIARQDQALPDHTRELLDLADRELQRVAHTARQTLGFYRESAGPGAVTVTQVLDEVLAVYSARAAMRQIRVETSFEDAGELSGLRGELRQLFSNLLANAIDATPEGGRIRVRVRRARRHGRAGISVAIADSGSGIPSDLHGRIFEPFFTTKKDVGTGLGLWLASEIVQKHSGEIRLRSSMRPTRSGSIFLVFLPTTTAEQAAPALAHNR
jgi:PAS domain S-box-containing protein